MKTVSDVKLNYLVRRLRDQILADRQELSTALREHLADEGNPHGVSLEQVAGVQGGSLLDYVYPVGAVFITMDSRSPSALFGGTWERLTDAFLLGAGGKYTCGEIGGEESHTLTTAEMPRHNHLFSIGYHTSSDPMFDKSRTAVNFNDMAKTSQGSSDSSTIWETGSSKAHNNMPPYLAVNMWRRVS